MTSNPAERPSLSVVIPMYNEGPQIFKSLTVISRYCTEAGFTDWEIIVVDDGSQDDSAVQVERFMGSHPSVRLLRNPGNRGKGYSVSQGVFDSRFDFILFSDADLSAPIEEVEKLFLALGGGYDISIGSRSLQNSVIEVPQPLYRVLIGKSLVGFLYLFFGMTFVDTQCGFKLFKAEVGKRIFEKMEIHRFGFDVEFLYLAVSMGFQVVEVPIRWINSDKSSVRPVRDSIQALWDLLRFRWRIKRTGK